MTFNSLAFILFFLVVLVLSTLTPQNRRWYILLTASCVFYAQLDIRALLLLSTSTAIDYGIAVYIDTHERTALRKIALAISLILNLTLLLGFKYLNFFTGAVLSLLSFSGLNLTIPHLSLIIPVGISFFTFKKISYVIDVYRGTIAVERHFGYFALYVSHFLEILSGPIDRAGRLIPQLRQSRAFSIEDVAQGTLLILWGCFMKVVVADRLAIYTDTIFNNIGHHNGPSLVIAAYFYTFQIYCDFAGYTNIAIGCGRLMGIDLMPNFNLPYFSKSIADFWRRWHISLSSWFRDYLYITLGGNRVSKARLCLNFMLIFLLCGLWHGANWTFLIWGGLHGFYLSIGFLTQELRLSIVRILNISRGLHEALQILITFHLAVIAWVFFRANCLADVSYFFGHLLTGWPHPFLDLNSMAYGMTGLCIVTGIEIMQYKWKLSMDHFRNLPLTLRCACYYALFLAVILCGVDGDSAFIYFQF
jgi:alginate O-acetyltransferase complex protein AlgI